MNSEIRSAHDASDRYLAAVSAAGEAVIAVRSGMGIATVGIEHAKTGDDNSYRALCMPRRVQGAASYLRFLVAGEAAQVALGLLAFGEVNNLAEHRAAAEVIRDWDSYWRPYPYFYSLCDDWSVNEEDEEIKHLIWLARWQVRRRFRYEPERSIIEKLALSIRDGKEFSGAEVERFIRAHCRSQKRK